MQGAATWAYLETTTRSRNAAVRLTRPQPEGTAPSAAHPCVVRRHQCLQHLLLLTPWAAGGWCRRGHAGYSDRLLLPAQMDIGGGSDMQPVQTFTQRRFDSKHLFAAFFGRLNVARREFSFFGDERDDRTERFVGKRIDRDLHRLIEPNVAQM